MRMLDADEQAEVYTFQLYLTPSEAKELITELEKLLKDPEANEHFHVGLDTGRDFSCSLITDNKMKDISGYTQLEQKILKKR